MLNEGRLKGGPEKMPPLGLRWNKGGRVMAQMAYCLRYIAARNKSRETAVDKNLNK